MPMVCTSLKFSLGQLKLFSKIKVTGGKPFFFHAWCQMYFKNPSWVGFLDASFGSDGALSSWHSWWAWPGRQSPQRAHGKWWVMSKQRVSCISNCQKQCRCEGHQCLFGFHAKSDTKLLRDIPECWHQQWMNFSHQCRSLLEPFGNWSRIFDGYFHGFFHDHMQYFGLFTLYFGYWEYSSSIVFSEVPCVWGSHPSVLFPLYSISLSVQQTFSLWNELSQATENSSAVQWKSSEECLYGGKTLTGAKIRLVTV